MNCELTEKEKEVVTLICKDKCTKEAAVLLGISPKTIEYRRASVYRKVGVDSPVGIFRWAIRNKLVRI